MGCKIVLIEGPSDQYYLNAIKNTLIAKGAITPHREILFVPAGGTRGIKTTSRILSSDDANYPSVLLDGDASGRHTKKQLEKDLYEGRTELLASVTDFVDIENAEVEDLIEKDLLTRIITQEFRGQSDFDDVYNAKLSIIPQVKEYCKAEDIEQEKGWKVDIARVAKQRMAKPSYINNVSQSIINQWVKLFKPWVEYAED